VTKIEIILAMIKYFTNLNDKINGIEITFQDQKVTEVIVKHEWKRK